MTSTTWIELSKSALKNNLHLIKQSISKDIKIALCIKGNGYGHGMLEIAEQVCKTDKSQRIWFCVDEIDEYTHLRHAGIKNQIIIIGPFFKLVELQSQALVTDNQVHIFTSNYQTAKYLSSIGVKYKTQLNIHLKVDTGMCRQGVTVNQALPLIAKIEKLPGVKLSGIATHFANADGPLNNMQMRAQITDFQKLKDHLGTKSKKYIWHAANSAAIFAYPQTHYDLVRPGIALYGYSPFSKQISSPEAQHPVLKNYQHRVLNASEVAKLQPVLTWKTKTADIKNIKKGDRVSYGGTYRAAKPTRIAVLPVGYYDGLSRRLSNRGAVLIKDRKCKIVGNICMNLTLVQLPSSLQNVEAGDDVILIEGGGKAENLKITANQLASKTGTINYEILTSIRQDMPRLWI